MNANTNNVRTDTVITDQFSMDYCSFGQGRGTLVVLPGISVQSVMPMAEAIAEQYKVLCDDFTIYVFDRRKGLLPSSYTVKDMTEDTAHAMRELGLENADIFGASQGGMMAMMTAIDHPDLVHKIIIGSSSACISDETFKTFDKLTALAGEGKAEELYLMFGEMLYPENVFEAVKDSMIEAAKSVTQDELDRFIIMTEGMKGFDILAEIGKISCPALVIGSEDDRVLGGEASRKIAGALENSPDCELYMYDGFGHAVYDCAPDYQERMLAFLTR